MITNVYGPLNDPLWLEFYEELRMIRMLSDAPWLVIDDFNLIHSNDEMIGSSRPEAHIDSFNNILEELHLIKVPLQGQKFTYSNGRPQPTLSRFDRASMRPMG
jgi:hypothetical protein